MYNFDFFKSTRLFKIRRIGFAQIRSWATAHSDPADYIPVFTDVLTIDEVKLEVEWKFTLLSFELADIRPRPRRVGVPTCSGVISILHLRSNRQRFRHRGGQGVRVLKSHPHVRRISTTARVLPIPKQGNDHDSNQLVSGC